VVILVHFGFVIDIRVSSYKGYHNIKQNHYTT